MWTGYTALGLLRLIRRRLDGWLTVAMFLGDGGRRIWMVHGWHWRRCNGIEKDSSSPPVRSCMYYFLTHWPCERMCGDRHDRRGSGWADAVDVGFWGFWQHSLLERNVLSFWNFQFLPPIQSSTHCRNVCFKGSWLRTTMSWLVESPWLEAASVYHFVSFNVSMSWDLMEFDVDVKTFREFNCCHLDARNYCYCFFCGKRRLVGQILSLCRWRQMNYSLAF